MIIPAQLRIGTWVVLHDGSKKYIGDVDHDGTNPDNPTKMFALYLTDIKGGFGQWVPSNEVASVHSDRNPYQDKPWNSPTDLGVATWSNTGPKTTSMNELHIKPEGRFMFNAPADPDMPETASFGAEDKPHDKMEVFVNGEWVEVEKNVFKSWSGKRRLNGKPYDRPVNYWMSKEKVKKESSGDYKKECNWCGKPTDDRDFCSTKCQTAWQKQMKGLDRVKFNFGDKSGKKKMNESKQCNWCGKPVAGKSDFCCKSCEDKWEKVASVAADYEDPSLTSKQKQASWKQHGASFKSEGSKTFEKAWKRRMFEAIMMYEGLENKVKSLLQDAGLEFGEDYEITYDRRKMQIVCTPPAMEKTVWQVLQDGGLKVRWVKQGVLGFDPIIEAKLEKLRGGKGDNLDTSDVDQEQLRVGTAVEMEHSHDPRIATEIAMDHLAENPVYYTMLVDSGIVDEPDAVEIAKRSGVSKGKKQQEPAQGQPQQQGPAKAPPKKAPATPPKPKASAPAVRESEENQFKPGDKVRHKHEAGPYGSGLRGTVIKSWRDHVHGEVIEVETDWGTTETDHADDWEDRSIKEGDDLLHHAKPGTIPKSAPVKAQSSTRVKESGQLDADRKNFGSKQPGSIISTKDGQYVKITGPMGYWQGEPAWPVLLNYSSANKKKKAIVRCDDLSIVSQAHEERDDKHFVNPGAISGLDSPPNLAEMVDDVVVLQKIDKIRDEIQKLYRTPTKDAYGMQQKINKLQKQQRDLEHSLYKELDMAEGISTLSNLILEVDILAGKNQPLSYDASNKTFSAEMSSIPNLGKGHIPKTLFVKNPETGSRVEFRFTVVDKDAEQEITGLRYQSVDGKYKLLLVND